VVDNALFYLDHNENHHWRVKARFCVGTNVSGWEMKGWTFGGGHFVLFTLCMFALDLDK